MDPGTSRTVLIALVLVLLTYACSGARSHENYPAWCCNGDGEHGDCRPVGCEELAEGQDGIKYKSLLFAKDRIFPSPDERCHVCIQGPATPMCVFVKPTS